MSDSAKSPRSIQIFDSSNSGSNRASGEGDHEGRFLIPKRTFGRDRPYKNRFFVGATFMVALRSEDHR